MKYLSARFFFVLTFALPLAACDDALGPEVTPKNPAAPHAADTAEEELQRATEAAESFNRTKDQPHTKHSATVPAR